MGGYGNFQSVPGVVSAGQSVVAGVDWINAKVKPLQAALVLGCCGSLSLVEVDNSENKPTLLHG